LKRQTWTPEQVASLESIAGSTYSPRICEEYNRWASKNGFCRRTRFAITSAMSRYKISRKAECGFVTSGCIAELLGVSLCVPQRWVEKGYISAVYSGKQRSPRYYRRSDVVAMARRYPELLGGVSRDRLFLLLEDAELADAIASAYPRHKGAGRPIQVVETGQVFPSIRAAAKAFYVCRQSIYFSITRNGTCAGFHWKYVEQPNQSQLCQTQDQSSLDQLVG
jgi:hypothetical protein